MFTVARQPTMAQPHPRPDLAAPAAPPHASAPSIRALLPGRAPSSLRRFLYGAASCHFVSIRCTFGVGSALVLCRCYVGSCHFFQDASKSLNTSSTLNPLTGKHLCPTCPEQLALRVKVSPLCHNPAALDSPTKGTMILSNPILTADSEALAPQADSSNPQSTAPSAPPRLRGEPSPIENRKPKIENLPNEPTDPPAPNPQPPAAPDLADSTPSPAHSPLRNEPIAIPPAAAAASIVPQSTPPSQTAIIPTLAAPPSGQALTTTLHEGPARMPPPRPCANLQPRSKNPPSFPEKPPGVLRGVAHSVTALCNTTGW